jgi:hypothetical protein
MPNVSLLSLLLGFRRPPEVKAVLQGIDTVHEILKPTLESAQHAIYAEVEAIRIMVEKRMDVRLVDPTLEAKRKALEMARDLPKPTSLYTSLLRVGFA